ncbi:MAG: hypothetical protein COB83_08615 [Gammaproteobacteria bacterium]|nr:MAG: hypothetical protein COB83_08615 [Gammaproteobacteria bacterium]
MGGFVLDGFIIEKNVLEQTSKKLAEVKTDVLKKHYRTILASVLVHIVMLILLFSIAEKQQPKEMKIIPKAIKSYLYKMPTKLVREQPVIAQPVIVKEEVKSVLIEEKSIEKIVDVKQDKLITPQEKVQQTVAQNKAVKAATTPESLSTKTTSQTPAPVQATFSAYQQLDNLRKSINEKIMSQELTQLQQFRSPSVMHGEQIPVPHSNKQLTPEQTREKNTTKMSNEISITKHDNGTCTITREQFLGSPVPGSSSGFACGESKFDKSFRAHMKKVQAKLLPVKQLPAETK